MIRWFLIFAVTAFCVTAAAPGAARADAALEKAAHVFVQKIADDAIATLTNSETPREIRVRHFRQLFQDRFAVKTIGRFVLGRYWKKTSPAEQAEYLHLFEELMIQRYVDRFAAYSGETLEMLDTTVEKPTRVRVKSRILRPDASKAPVEVEWVVGVKGSSIRVLDVFISKVSMAQTLRADFGSIARADGIPGLLQALRDKLADLSKSSG